MNILMIAVLTTLILGSAAQAQELPTLSSATLQIAYYDRDTKTSHFTLTKGTVQLDWGNGTIESQDISKPITLIRNGQAPQQINIVDKDGKALLYCSESELSGILSNFVLKKTTYSVLVAHRTRDQSDFSTASVPYGSGACDIKYGEQFK